MIPIRTFLELSNLKSFTLGIALLSFFSSGITKEGVSLFYKQCLSDLLTCVPVRTVRAFKWTGATQAGALDVSNKTCPERQAIVCTCAHMKLSKGKQKNGLSKSRKNVAFIVTN